MDNLIKYKGQLYRRVDSDDQPNIKTNIELTGIPEYVQKVCGLIDYISYLGNIGASREIKVWVDGDGAFAINVKFDKLLKEPAKAVSEFLGSQDEGDSDIRLSLD